MRSDGDEGGMKGGRIRWKGERERKDEEREREEDGQDKIEGWRDSMARYGTNGATHDERKV